MCLFEQAAFAFQECSTRSISASSATGTRQNRVDSLKIDDFHAGIAGDGGATFQESAAPRPKSFHQHGRGNREVNLHRTVPVILDRLDLNLSSSHGESVFDVCSSEAEEERGGLRGVL